MAPPSVRPGRFGTLGAGPRARVRPLTPGTLARRRGAEAESVPMLRLWPAAAAAALLVFAPLGAGAIENARPLRTLTYAIDVTVIHAIDTPGGTVARSRSHRHRGVRRRA